MEEFVKGLAIFQLIPKNKFNEIAQRWQIDKGVTKLSAQALLDTLMRSLVFEKKTLRDMADSYFIAKSTLDDALRKRPHGFFQELFSLAIKELIGQTQDRKDRKDLREILALDASICSVHGSMASQFIGTKIEAKTAGIKLHAIWNVNTEWVEDFRVTMYRRNDGAIGNEFQFSRGKFYTFDRAYVDLKLWLKIQDAGSHFVTRLKKIGNRLSYIHRAYVDNETTGILYDRSWTPCESACYSLNLKPKRLVFRHIIYRDPESKKLFDFITSDFASSAMDIANIYRKRWAVELLFRWLKGHLNIRRFNFKNMNAIKIMLSAVMILQILLRFKMLLEKFNGTNWDYLRSLRNSLDRFYYQSLTQGGFDPPISLKAMRNAASTA